jgi:hypothetical protein
VKAADPLLSFILSKVSLPRRPSAFNVVSPHALLDATLPKKSHTPTLQGFNQGEAMATLSSTPDLPEVFVLISSLTASNICHAGLMALPTASVGVSTSKHRL